ncbi:GNAT family N-acetyltransferase [Halotalea alkalilenta]|uniref:GNAT family N-acetyltransferase n=1 Tax=Halotalea alkalilenta TaxID=376489 RepID=UPI000AE02FEA|nr:GNAT family N-acetyltransferase [Halotalea alkalilenta]
MSAAGERDPHRVDQPSDLRLRRLARGERALGILSGWQYEQWGGLHPHQNARSWEAALTDECGAPGQPVPSSYVLELDGEILGGIQLLAYDMDLEPAWTPWLASVFIAPQARGQGLAGWMVATLAERARSAGLERLYLYTPDQQALYARLGWREIDRREWLGEWVSVMLREL